MKGKPGGSTRPRRLLLPPRRLKGLPKTPNRDAKTAQLPTDPPERSEGNVPAGAVAVGGAVRNLQHSGLQYVEWLRRLQTGGSGAVFGTVYMGVFWA